MLSSFLLRTFPMHFDEKSMFAGNRLEAQTLKVSSPLQEVGPAGGRPAGARPAGGRPQLPSVFQEEFRLHFKNISRIMDCVGCSKCRLWGKLQVSSINRRSSRRRCCLWRVTEVLCLQIQGLGTALKILFSEKEIQKLPEHSSSKGFQLTRQEIVALINAFGRSAPCSSPPNCASPPPLLLTSSLSLRLSTSIHQLHTFRLLLEEHR